MFAGLLESKQSIPAAEKPGGVHSLVSRTKCEKQYLPGKWEDVGKKKKKSSIFLAFPEMSTVIKNFIKMLGDNQSFKTRQNLSHSAHSTEMQAPS